MEYFILTQGKRAKPIALKTLPPEKYRANLTAEGFEKLDSLEIAYFQNSVDVEVTDIIQSPTLMVSQAVRALLELYDENIEFKAVQAFSIDIENIVAPLYWIPKLKTIDCMHGDTKKFNTGTLQDLVLDRRKLEHEDIFRIANVLESRVVISLALAESLLRRGLYSVGLEEVRIK